VKDLITEEEIELLKASMSDEDWNNACSQIKEAHGGYPSDWWSRVMASGLGDEIMNKWGGSSEIKLVSYPATEE